MSERSKPGPRGGVATLARPAAVLGWAAAGPAVGGALVFLALLPQAETLRAGGVPVAAALLLLGALACGFALVPTHLLSLVAGWSLGFAGGTAVAVAAAMAAATLGHAAGRRLAGPAPLAWAAGHPRGAAACAAIAGASPARAALLVGLVRLSPAVPFAVTNTLAAVLGVRRGPLFWGTLAGLAPRVAAVAALGAGLGRLEWTRPDAPWLVAAGVAATAASIAALGWITRHTFGRLAPDAAPPPRGPSHPDRLGPGG